MRPEAAPAPPTVELSPVAPPARRAWCVFACLAVCTLTPPTIGAVEDDTRLAAVRREIYALQKAVAKDSGRLDVARRREQAVANDIATAIEKQNALEQRIARKAARVEALTAERRDLEQRHASARLALHRQTLARYALLVQPPLKRLLNQGEARRLGRNLAYSEYLLAAYRRDLDSSRSAGEALELTAAALKLETDSLRRLRQETADHLVQLGDVQARHAELLAAMAANVDASEARVLSLREDEQRLLALVGELAARPSPTASLAHDGPAFATLAGKLDWPAAGAVASAADGAIREGGAHWAGVLIETAALAEVRAVAAGRVVFANHFRNLGELIIVDHGDGYMTLYGNNGALRRAAGDEVAAGEVIAEVGATSGELARGLYFELRAGGVPLDPRRWCVAR